MSTATATLYRFTDTDSVMGEGDSRYILKVKDLPSDEKPREKLAIGGPGSLSMAELVAVLLGVGTKKEEVMSMAGRILKEYGERAIVNETNPQRLADELQIPLPKACQLIASFELGRRFYQERAGRAIFVSTAKQAFDYLKDMGQMQKEQLRGLYLNSRYRVVHEEVISVGSMTSNIVHPREVFQPAIEYGAVAIIIAHNHPSGRLEATYADNEVTERLLVASKILGIDLLDHLIIAGDKYQSIIETP
ncbi:MAG: RadC family protein [Candidatus Saccharimonadales bacterium]